MKLSLIIFLSLLIFTGIAENHTSTEGISEQRPEAGNGNKDAIILHSSLKSLREYLETLNRHKNLEEEPASTEEPSGDHGLGPHYHIMYTNEPSVEVLPEELRNDESTGSSHPKDLFFQPIPISDKGSTAERNLEVGAGDRQQIRETILLAISSATLVVLLLLTVFCAVAIYYCTKPYRYSDDFSLTSSEKQALFYPYDSSLTTTEDSGLIWNERLLTIQSSSETKHARSLSISSYVDEISTFSDESVRTTERDKSEAEQCELASCQAAPSSMPPPAVGAPPETPPTQGVPPPAEGAPPPAEGAPPPAEGAPPPAEGTPPLAEGAPPPAEGAPPPAEGMPPPAEGAPPPAEGVPPPAEGPPPPAEGEPPKPPAAEGAPLPPEEAPSQAE